MKTVITQFFGAFIFALVLAAASFAQDGQITGGYAETDVKDAGVVEAAKVAVSKQRVRTGTKIVLLKVMNAKVQVVAGLNYELCLKTQIRQRNKRYIVRYARVVVYKNLKGAYSLTSWTALKNQSGC